MRKILLGAALLAATAVPAYADVGVSVRVGEPGFYGRIDIGDYSPPAVVYTRPVIVERRVVVDPAPIYLRVPPGHRKHWAKHCREYDACGREVYFVTDAWYENEYAPRYRHDRDDDDRDHDEHGHGDWHGKGHGRRG